MTLSARIEAAEGPSMALEMEIAAATGAACVWPPKAYTTSLDMAMTLVPDGWNKAILIEENQPVRVGLQLGTRGEFNAVDVCAATPELALCAAALKARGL